MRVLLCSARGSHGTDGDLADVLLPALRAAGADAVRQVGVPTGGEPADWWLVLDYVSTLPAWLAADRGGARIAYTEGCPGSGVDLSMPWRQDAPDPLAPFVFLPESARGGRAMRSGLVIDEGWPPFLPPWDLAATIRGGLAGWPAVAFRHAAETIEPMPGCTISDRLPRPKFLDLLAGSIAFVVTHRECWSAAVMEALFLGCRVLAHPDHVAPGLFSLGAESYSTVEELLGLLSAARGRPLQRIASIDETAVEMVHRLRTNQG